jgi:hypothetical protein
MRCCSSIQVRGNHVISSMQTPYIPAIEKQVRKVQP